MAYDLATLGDDLDLPTTGGPVSGARLVAQRIRIRLARHRGEVLTDRNAGLPWIEWAETMPAPVRLITARIVDEIASTRGVASVRDVAPRFDVATGAYSLSLRVLLDGDAGSFRVEVGPTALNQIGGPWASLMLGVLL